MSDAAKTILQLTENLHRQDLHPVEEARALRQIMTEQSLTHEQLAKQVGKSRVYVTETVGLLDKLTRDELALIDTMSAGRHLGRTLILAATWVRDPAIRQAILRGDFTRQEARDHGSQAKPDGRTRGTTHRFALPALHAKVTVTIQKAGASQEDVRAALDAARAELARPRGTKRPRGGKR